MRKVKNIFFKGEDINGEVGIEIEMEGKGFPLENLDSWYSREDGSLRGDLGCRREYVLIRPCKREGVKQRLDSLQGDLLEVGAKIHSSYRTGVHVHLNIRDMTFNQVWTFIFTYLMLEDAMMKFCGEGREGNLFCLRNRDAENMMTYMEDAIKKEDFRKLHTDEIRYSSMNLKAIQQYGSIEFRGLSFEGDFDSINLWVDLLTAIKDWSLSSKTPIYLLEQLSKLGGDTLAKDIFKGNFFYMPHLDWDEVMLEGIRRVQGLIYLKDWEEEDKSCILKVGLKNEPVLLAQKIKPAMILIPQPMKFEV